MPGLLSQIGSRHKAVGKPMDCPALVDWGGFASKIHCRGDEAALAARLLSVARLPLQCRR